MARIIIDGKAIEVADTATILQAAKLLKIHYTYSLPSSKAYPFGGCRLCIVEVKGMPKPVTSCTTFVSNGMEITTSNPYLQD